MLGTNIGVATGCVLIFAQPPGTTISYVAVSYAGSTSGITATFGLSTFNGSQSYDTTTGITMIANLFGPLSPSPVDSTRVLCDDTVLSGGMTFVAGQTGYASGLRSCAIYGKASSANKFLLLSLTIGYS